MAAKDDKQSSVQCEQPEWLKSDIFVPLLKTTIEGFESIKAFKVVPGTQPGDNYATIMLRIELEIGLSDTTTKHMAYMLKIPHSSAIYNETLGKFNIFALERDMYSIYVEEFKQLYRNAGVEVDFSAKSSALDIEQEYVLLEDLRLRGFKTADRLAGLDKQQTLSVLQKLAQWHAASAVRVCTKGAYPKQQTGGIFSETNKSLLQALTDRLVKYVLSSAQTIEGHEAYYKDLQQMEGHIYDMTSQVANVNPDEFNVLNHGDCWMNNIMFQYDDAGKLQHTYLVDYQAVVYGTVAIDLLYFLVSSPKLELKVKEFDSFIKYYHDQLIENLKLLNYSKKLPSLIDIHTSLLKHGIWGYCTTAGVLTGVLLEDTKNAKFDNLFADTPDGESFRTLLFTGRLYKEHIKVLLPWLQNRGALQCSNSKSN